MATVEEARTETGDRAGQQEGSDCRPWGPCPGVPHSRTCSFKLPLAAT